MKKTLKEVADYIGGIVDGDENVEIKGVKPITEAGKGDITFITHIKYVKYVAETLADAIIIDKNIEIPIKKNLIKMENPYYGYSKAIHLFYSKERKVKGIHKSAVLEDDVVLGKDVNIGANVYIGAGSKIGDRVDIHPGVYVGDNCVIGDDTVINPNVTIYYDGIIGKRVIIHAGTVIGSDGFGFAQDKGIHHKILQVGRVIVEDDVEIGANTTIDRATLGETVIGAGTKIDNQVQIAHNVKIGRGCIIVSQVGISGSTKLGNYVVLAGQVGVVGHISVGDGVVVGAQSGVARDVPPGTKLFGSPALPESKAKRVAVINAQLPELRKRIFNLEKEIKALKEK